MYVCVAVATVHKKHIAFDSQVLYMGGKIFLARRLICKIKVYVPIFWTIDLLKRRFGLMLTYYGSKMDVLMAITKRIGCVQKPIF